MYAYTHARVQMSNRNAQFFPRASEVFKNECTLVQFYRRLIKTAGNVHRENIYFEDKYVERILFLSTDLIILNFGARRKPRVVNKKITVPFSGENIFVFRCPHFFSLRINHLFCVLDIWPGLRRS